MEQDRFLVIDNKKGVVIPLAEERKGNLEGSNDCETEEKVNKLKENHCFLDEKCNLQMYFI